jgi:hypothetical protein
VPEELDALAARLTAASVKIIRDESHPGARRFDVEDPSGNRIELALERDRRAVGLLLTDRLNSGPRTPCRSFPLGFPVDGQAGEAAPEQTQSRRLARAKGSAAPIDPLDDVVECGGELYYAVDFTPAGFPIGPRVEIVEGELRFLDEEILDLESFTDEPES